MSTLGASGERFDLVLDVGKGERTGSIIGHDWFDG
jgi:hypothetical protein